MDAVELARQMMERLTPFVPAPVHLETSGPMPAPHVVVTESEVVLGFHVDGEPVIMLESLERR